MNKKDFDIIETLYRDIDLRIQEIEKNIKKLYKVSGSIEIYIEEQEVFASNEDEAMQKVADSYCADNSDLEAEEVKY